MCTIYKIYNTVSGFCYIGSTKHFDIRMLAHKSILRRGVHKSTGLQEDYNKYGESSLVFISVKELKRRDDAFLFEKWLILNTENVYNVLKHPVVSLYSRKTSEEIYKKLEILLAQ